MKRTLIALALALGTTAAFATPTLQLSGADYPGWKRAEGTVYQSATQGKSTEPRHDYPFTWNP